LDWIFQIQAKRWGREPGVVEELVWLLELLLQPQENLCSRGMAGVGSKKIAKKRLRKLVTENFREGVGLQIESGIIPPPKGR